MTFTEDGVRLRTIFFTLKWPFAPFFRRKTRFFGADIPMHIQSDHDFICRLYLHMWNLQIRVCISASQIIYLLEQTPKKTPKNRRISPIWCLSPFHAAQGSEGPPSMILRFLTLGRLAQYLLGREKEAQKISVHSHICRQQCNKIAQIRKKTAKDAIWLP